MCESTNKQYEDNIGLKNFKRGTKEEAGDAYQFLLSYKKISLDFKTTIFNQVFKLYKVVR